MYHTKDRIQIQNYYPVLFYWLAVPGVSRGWYHTLGVPEVSTRHGTIVIRYHTCTSTHPPCIRPFIVPNSAARWDKKRLEEAKKKKQKAEREEFSFHVFCVCSHHCCCCAAVVLWLPCSFCSKLFVVLLWIWCHWYFHEMRAVCMIHTIHMTVSISYVRISRFNQKSINKLSTVSRPFHAVSSVSSSTFDTTRTTTAAAVFRFFFIVTGIRYRCRYHTWHLVTVTW